MAAEKQDRARLEVDPNECALCLQKNATGLGHIERRGLGNSLAGVMGYP
jgi:hypothetical protein